MQLDAQWIFCVSGYFLDYAALSSLTQGCVFVGRAHSQFIMSGLNTSGILLKSMLI
jgi:hypothetical protein